MAQLLSEALSIFTLVLSPQYPFLVQSKHVIILKLHSVLNKTGVSVSFPHHSIGKACTSNKIAIMALRGFKIPVQQAFESTNVQEVMRFSITEHGSTLIIAMMCGTLLSDACQSDIKLSHPSFHNTFGYTKH